jgi:cell division protein ZapA
MSEPVELRVGGQTYRVVSSADPPELRRLAEVVDARLRERVPAGRQVPPQALILAAISLAHELEQERARRVELERRSREMLKALLARIDAVIDVSEPSAAELDSEAEADFTNPDV